MIAKTVKLQLVEHLRTHSHFEQQRSYLGMSGIARCPRQQYFNFAQGLHVTDADHARSYVGYLFEADVRARLADLCIYKPDSAARELVAPFDDRFRGHIDGETMDDELLEIKSVNAMLFEKIEMSFRPKTEHVAQVQTYMRYGPWEHALIVYVDRDSFAHLVIHVAKQERIGEEMEQKAKKILAAIDRREPPACECNYCKR